MTNNCYIYGGPRGGKTRLYTCANSACKNNWRGYSHDMKALDNEVAYQQRQFGPRKKGDPVNPWVAWAQSKRDDAAEALRERWHVHPQAPERG